MGSSHVHFVRRGKKERVKDVHRSPRKAFVQKFLIWSCFSYYGVGTIAILPGTMTTGRYVQVLEQHLLPVAHHWFPRGGWTFVHDNAPCHKSKETTAFLTRKRIRCMNWPPYSPDLNAIENMWAILKERIHRSAPPGSRSEMENLVKKIWSEDPVIQSACTKLSDSMVSRAWKVIDNKGAAIDY
jgi:hypothetical protein